VIRRDVLDHGVDAAVGATARARAPARLSAAERESHDAVAAATKAKSASRKDRGRAGLMWLPNARVHLQSAGRTGAGTRNLVRGCRAHNLMPSALADATDVRLQVGMDGCARGRLSEATAAGRRAYENHREGRDEEWRGGCHGRAQDDGEAARPPERTAAPHLGLSRERCYAERREEREGSRGPNRSCRVGDALGQRDAQPTDGEREPGPGSSSGGSASADSDVDQPGEDQ
jgi:hypothetical protein